MRVLPVERIPPSLWSGDALHLAPPLAERYLSELDRLALREASAQPPTKDHVFGGKTLSETLEHFAHRFTSSGGRVQYSTIAPSTDLGFVSDALLSTFSDGHVALLDIPCGTGAMSASLVATLTALRSANVLPRLPLTMTICAGDFSLPSREIFERMMGGLQGQAVKQGITISWDTHDWDATRSDHTAAMMDHWLERTSTATEHCVVISNFSGALHNAGKFGEFSPCLEHILARLHNRRSTVLWLEPAAKGAKTGVMRFLSDFVARRAPWLLSQKPGEPAEAQYQVVHPVSSVQFRSNVMVQKFDRR